MHREVLTDDTAFLFLFIRIIFWLQRKFSLLFQLEYFLEQLIDIYIVFGGRFQVSNFPHFLQQCNVRHLHIQQTCSPPRAPRRSWWRPGACPPPRRTCCRPAARASPPDSPSPAHHRISSSSLAVLDWWRGWIVRDQGKLGENNYRGSTILGAPLETENTLWSNWDTFA